MFYCPIGDGQTWIPSGSATESFSYSADSSFVRQYILPEVEDRFNDVRYARYYQTARATASFDPNNPNATDPPPTITGDDRVIETGVHSHTNRKNVLGMPMVTTTTRILETGWTTVTSTIHLMGVDGDDFGGLGSHTVSYFEPNWDRRSVYESGLEGIL
jgi:hypothetical protein